MDKNALVSGQWQEELRQNGFPARLLDKLGRQGGESIQISGDKLRLRLFPDEQAEVPGEWLELDILYEDDFCLVAYKPAGMPVHAAVAGQGGTLGHALSAYYDSTGQACRLRHIHRLDEDTTGPVLYAKNEFAHLVLDEAMRERRIHRIYAAIVQGKLIPAEGIIDQPIGKDRHHPKRRRVSPGGEYAQTRYLTLDTAPHASLVELKLETGRTHQIRVHMQHMGAPLAGDELYGGSVRHMRRQALHGQRLEFPHPWTGEEITVEAQWPADFSALWSLFKEGMRP